MFIDILKDNHGDIVWASDFLWVKIFISLEIFRAVIKNTTEIVLSETVEVGKRESYVF